MDIVSRMIGDIAGDRGNIPGASMHVWIPGTRLRGHLGRTSETSVGVRHDGEWLQLSIF